MNWLVGSTGAQQEGGWAPDEPFGWWEAHNSPVEPRSLYLKQLEARLGPASVNAVTTEAQRQGRLWGAPGAPPGNHLGASWGRLGDVLGSLGASLGSSWAVSGRLGSVLGKILDKNGTQLRHSILNGIV